MTLNETYPIHRCVYRNDQVALTELLKDEEIKKHINERDNHGNSPLNLALMLGRRNCIITLVNNGCDIISRNDYGWNPLEESIFLGDVDIIEKITELRIKAEIQAFSKITLKKWNKVLPSVYFKSKIKIKSPIPVLAKLLGSDTLEIYKRGDYFRLNTTIAGYTLKGIPRVKKGSMSILIRFYEETGECKCVMIDNKKKTYQEVYPNLPQWCISDIIRSNINIKTLYKIFFDFSECIIKQKKGSLLKKSKKTFQTNDGKTYKADLFKIKGIKAVVRKRDNEIVIGDYKSDIRTKVLNLTGDPTKLKSLYSNGKTNTSNASLDTVSDNESDNESTYSENDSSLSESEEILDLSKESLNEVVNHDSLFKKYIKNETIDPETEKIITEIIMNGEDKDHQKIETNDLLYLSSNYPDYIENLLNKPVSRKKYIKMLKNLKLEDKSKENLNDNDDEEERPSTLSRRTKIKATEDPNVAFYRIISGIPTEEDVNSEKNEERDRLKNFDWSKNKITEEDYFNPSNTESMHMGRLMNIAENTKSNKYIRLWMTQKNEFPISLDHLEPIFDYVNMLFFDKLNERDPNNTNVDAILGKNNEFFNVLHEEQRFPLKIDFPIYPTVKMTIKTQECSIDPERIPDEIFKIPSDYVEDDVLFDILN